MTDVGETAGEDLDLALTCGLLRRWGPSPAQLAALPWWRRTVCQLLPRRQRWRVHPLAPQVRDFERCLGISATAGRGQG